MNLLIFNFISVERVLSNKMQRSTEIFKLTASIVSALVYSSLLIMQVIFIVQLQQKLTLLASFFTIRYR